MDDWMLCNQQQIQAFPSLIMYPKREKFVQHKSIENLLRFAMSFTKGQVIEFKSVDTYLKQLKSSKTPWLISFCLGSNSDDNEELNYELNCLEESIKKKLAVMLNGLVQFGSIECQSNNEINEKICKKLKPSRLSPIAFYSRLPNLDKDDEIDVKLFTSTDYKQINQQVLSYLPDLTLLDEIAFKVNFGELYESVY